ncbi:DnaJ C-terminal domain-containing protein [Paraburkholderia sediminicola]|uniref:DnaJ C-terminal domain-containing protein n=1 Tax=Paraburkholderia sediminicola TaxID=458836 RepID=UPI0038B7AA6B
MHRTLSDRRRSTTRTLTYPSAREITRKFDRRPAEGGQHLRLGGQRDVGPGPGPAGDLYLEIASGEDPHFRVDGHDVWLDVPAAP